MPGSHHKDNTRTVLGQCPDNAQTMSVHTKDNAQTMPGQCSDNAQTSSRQAFPACRKSLSWHCPENGCFTFEKQTLAYVDWYIRRLVYMFQGLLY